MIETLNRWLHGSEAGSEKKETRCLCCGKCCESFGGHLHASKGDLERWRSQGRDDLLDRVNRLGWIWVHPQTKQLEQACPFIERTGPDTACCGIYETRPDICRDYPTLAHGHRCLRGGFLKLSIAAVAVVGEHAAAASAVFTA